MKKVALTQGLFAVIDAKDYPRVSLFKWCVQRIRGHCYAVRSVYQKGQRYTEWRHRFIIDAPRGKQVDHINGNGLDNTRQNLRLVSNAQNHQAFQKKRVSSSQFRGVDWRPVTKNWRASIKVAGRSIHLGYYFSEESAAQAYNSAAKKYFGKFSSPNLI